MGRVMKPRGDSDQVMQIKGLWVQGGLWGGRLILRPSWDGCTLQSAVLQHRYPPEWYLVIVITIIAHAPVEIVDGNGAVDPTSFIVERDGAIDSTGIAVAFDC